MRLVYPYGALHRCACLCGRVTLGVINMALELDHARGAYSCARCGRCGDTANLVMLAEGVTRKGALAKLRARRLYARPQRAVPVEARVCLALAAAHYADTLQRTPRVLAHLAAHGVRVETVARLRLGYADGTLGDALVRAGIARKCALAAGLYTARRETLIGRLTLPVTDALASPVWLWGRALGVCAADNASYAGLVTQGYDPAPWCVGQRGPQLSCATMCLRFCS